MSTKIKRKVGHRFSTDLPIPEQPGGGGGPPPLAQSHVSITMASSVSPAAGAQKGEAKMTKESLGRARGIVWTLFDYENYIHLLEEEKCRYIVYGKEVCPDTGRLHLQGYVYYENPQSLKEFSTRFNNCHVEKQRGTAEQAADYCKEDGDWTERGELPKQGKRTDWAQAVEQLKTSEVSEVIIEQPQLLPCQRALREFKLMLLKPLHREVNVITLIGDAGSGKTRWVYENYPDAYSKPPEKQSGTYFDGYTGQKTLLLDDFYGGIPHCSMLRILDRYPFNAPISGGFVQAQWDTVIITSNKMPQEWYKFGLTPALRRRLKKVIYFSIIDGISQTQELSLQEAQSGAEEAGDA